MPTWTIGPWTQRRASYAVPRTPATGRATTARLQRLGRPRLPAFWKPSRPRTRPFPKRTRPRPKCSTHRWRCMRASRTSQSKPRLSLPCARAWRRQNPTKLERKRTSPTAKGPWRTPADGLSEPRRGWHSRSPRWRLPARACSLLTSRLEPCRTSRRSSGWTPMLSQIADVMSRGQHARSPTVNSWTRRPHTAESLTPSCSCSPSMSPKGSTGRSADSWTPHRQTSGPALASRTSWRWRSCSSSAAIRRRKPSCRPRPRACGLLPRLTPPRPAAPPRPAPRGRAPQPPSPAGCQLRGQVPRGVATWMTSTTSAMDTHGPIRGRTV